MGAVANGFQAPTAQRADVYAIYSRLMTNPRTSYGADKNEIYLIADTTVPGTPEEPCVRFPAEYRRDFDEIMSGFNRGSGERVKLEPAFHITKPYVLLDGSAVKEFVELFSSPRVPETRRKVFKKATDLFRLTDVYFNRDRTIALTAISTHCGLLCGRADWRVLGGARNGQWEERPWVTCDTIS
ncbi:MAG: hypothetical protein HYX25_07870 [Candidatus Solibacter usitatus]|nr:hypothetical protein [Candidatus Solibacter usitatus]